jgi:hypothetical protein
MKDIICIKISFQELKNFFFEKRCLLSILEIRIHFLTNSLNEVKFCYEFFFVDDIYIF